MEKSFEFYKKKEKSLDSQETSRSTVNRREFSELASNMAIAGSISAVLAQPEMAEASEKKDNYPITIIRRSQLDKIQFVEGKREIPVETQELIKAVIQYSNEIAGSMNSSNEFQEGSNQNVKQQHTDDEKRLFWEKIKSIVSRIPDSKPLPEFSSRAFDDFLVYDLPRILAPYGIFAKAIYKTGYNVGHDTIEFSNVAVTFSHISKIQKDIINMWGSEVYREILFTDELVDFPKQSMQTEGKGSVGQTFYRNIIIYKSALNTDSENPISPTIKEIAESLADIPSREYPLLLGKMLSPNEPPRKSAFLLAMVNLINRDLKPETKNQQLQNDLAHETGHLVDHQNPSFRDRWTRQITDSAYEDLVQSINLSAHEEINGILTELRYSPERLIAMKNVISLTMIDRKKEDMVYTEAGIWIINHLIEEISKNPGQYGMTVIPNSSIPIQDQLFSQLPSLLDSSEQFNQLLEKIYYLHVTNYEEDLSQEYIKLLKIRKGGSQDQDPWQLVLKLSKILLPIAAGGLGIKWWMERKKAVREFEKQKINNRAKSKKRKK